MLHYPKIPGSLSCPTGRCIAFEKVDGTNLHWDWERDFGWHSFGTRRDEFNLTDAGIAQFGQTHAHLKEAAEVFLQTLADGIEQVFRNNAEYQKFDSYKAFTEFVGTNSFAGLHKTEDAKQLMLFDVWAEGFGMIGPKAFVSNFGHLSIPRVVYEGRLTGKFIDDVRSGKYRVDEGVVCKGGTGGEDVWMVKIKTMAYMEKLKRAIGDKWEDYWE